MRKFTSHIFEENLLKIKDADKSIRDGVQSLVEMAINHWLSSDDTDKLTIVMNATKSLKSVNSRKIQLYIQRATLNAIVFKKVTEKKSGKVCFKFKKVKKGVKPLSDDKYIESTFWYNFDTLEGEARPDMDVVVQVRSLITRINNALEDGKCKQNRDDVTPLLDALAKFTA